MSFPRYPEYKDSGVEWLGQVPGHWEVTRLSYLADVLAGHSFDAALFGFDGLPVIRMSDFGDGTVQLDDVKRVDPSHVPERSLAKSGDVLLGLSGSISNFAIVRSQDIPIAINQRVAMVRLHKTGSSIVKWFLQSAEFFNQLVSVLPETTIQNISMSQLRSCSLPRPPNPEQTQIAAFLDRETAKIDALVAEQRRLMALLKEKRQAVISHAVTRGLNPEARLKPSGVEWLGDVPEHWEVGPLKRFWSVTDCKHVTAEFVDDGIPLASIREVQSRWVALENAKCTTKYFYELLVEGGRQPLPGDLIFSRNATVGEVAQVHSDHPPFAMGQDVVLLRKLSKSDSSDYLQHVIRSPIILLQLANMMIGSTFKRINVEEIRSFLMPSPPPSEQTEIATFLESESTKFDTLTAEAQRAIGLLQERRTALISAAVTGQIDVRSALASA